MRNPIIAALDVASLDTAYELADQIAGSVGALKIGGELFTRGGPEVVRRIRQAGASVFLDLKFHDIPNTVAKSVASAVSLDVQMLTVHCCGGAAMLRAAETAARETARDLGKEPPLVLGVTVLTSMDNSDLEQIGINNDVEAQVARLARVALDSGLRGLVCSPLEISLLRDFLPDDFQLVTPGIRATEDAMGDQKRTLSPSEALKAGANWLVIGRPIYQAEDPKAAAEKIYAGIK